MSLVQESPIICPQCEAEYKVPVWGSINISADPQLRDAIIQGRHFSVTCPECGYVSSIIYNTLYIDRDRKQIFCLVPQGAEDAGGEVERQAREAAGALLLPDDQFILRIVHSTDDLREKIIIFDSGLDDRIIEICKGVALSQVPDGLEVNDVRFAVIAGHRFLILYCKDEGEQYVTGFDSFYAQMEESYGSMLPPLYIREFLTVDIDYVSALLRGEL